MTIREQLQRGALTHVEDAGNATIREVPSVRQIPSSTKQTPSLFHGYRIVKQMRLTSTQADIFLAEKNGTQYFLKLYRYNIEPKREILQATKMLGEKYPGEFVHVYAADFDSQIGRWYELQEYIESGSLQTIINHSSKFTQEQRNGLFVRTAYEVGKALDILHKNNILHLDLKPSNILVRSAKPFDLVLIDFGIASTLSPELSKKFTQTRGTPMYQSPESWVGSMGRASDWWGLGMILLEIAAGSHPFHGLTTNVIASIIATRSIEIPDSIDARQRELLRGLLTRDPANRWNWEQVSRWLNGERDIGNKFEDAPTLHKSSGTKSYVSPLKFMGKQCSSLEDFSREAVQSEDTWDKAQTFLTRGYLRQWLEDNSDFDASIELDNLLADVHDDDEKLFCLIQKYGGGLPFVFCGHMITFKNLFIFTAKAFHREELTTMERKITASIDNGTLLRLLDSFSGSMTLELEAMSIVIKKLAGSSWSYQVGFWEFYAFPEKFYCPFTDDASDILEIAEKSTSIYEVPITLTEWQELEGEYFIPADITERMQDSSEYTSAVHALRKMKDSGLLLPKLPFSAKEAEIIQQKLLPLIKPEHHTLEFIDFYLHSQNYYCPFIKGRNFIAESEKLTYPPELLSEWQSLERRYHLPPKLVEKTLSAETYHDAVSKILSKAAEGTLIKKGE